MEDKPGKYNIELTQIELSVLRYAVSVFLDTGYPVFRVAVKKMERKLASIDKQELAMKVKRGLLQ